MVTAIGAVTSDGVGDLGTAGPPRTVDAGAPEA
jgi:hypothetical protein